MVMTFWVGLSLLMACASASNVYEALVAGELSVLSQHRVIYSEPRPSSREYESGNFVFNPRAMDHVYALTHCIMDFVWRDGVFPASINSSSLLDSDDDLGTLFKDHWEDFLLQYIGVLTVAIFVLIASVVIPISGFCMCLCRCAGKCGADPEHFDKRSDSFKRVMLGIALSTLVIGAVFGVVCTFVTTFYLHNGISKLPERLTSTAEDTSYFFDETGREIDSLLVTNFAELEEVLNEVLDESGPILKRSLAEVTEAVAIDDLSVIVSSLGTVKKYLKDIKGQTRILSQKVDQLRLGLNGTRSRLLTALRQCRDSRICSEFLREYDINDLDVASRFSSMSLPDLTMIMDDIDEIMDNDIERKVRVGQKQLDSIKIDIENSIRDLRPKIKSEIRRMGKQLEDNSAEIQNILNEFDTSFDSMSSDVPKLKPVLDEYGYYLYYIGLGMSCLVLLILICYVLGLFYGFCGKRPGNLYGDDCCNKGTGANWLLTAVYLTFLFSFALLVVATCQFVIGIAADKIICESIKHPNDSEIFKLLDDKFIQPQLNQGTQKIGPISELIEECHLNHTIYEIFRIHELYDVEELRDWRNKYGIGDFIGNLGNKIRLQDLDGIEILSPQAQHDLEELAESPISDLNFTKYSNLLEDDITDIDLPSFIRKLRQVKERISRSNSGTAAAIENEALFLDQMQRVVIEMRVALRHLKTSVAALEAEAKFNKASMREALTELINRASKATSFLRTEGPQLIDQLTNRYINETVSLIDDYVDRVINRTENHIGKCSPLSTAYNATVRSVCQDIMDPLNGFWVSIGWCYLAYLPSIALAIALVSLYKKSEPYPGPLMEPVVVDRQHTTGPQQQQQPPPGKKKSKRRSSGGGHRRNPSEHLPDSAHYRAGYSYQNRFQDMAPRTYERDGATAAILPHTSNSIGSGGPPRYTSNPNLNVAAAVAAPTAATAPPPAAVPTATGGAPPTGDYERPPPYYYPGPANSQQQQPPQLPPPNSNRM